MATMWGIVLGTVLVFVVYGNALKLPSYIKACSRNDPDISACVLRNGKEALPKILKRGGDRKYNIPDLEPLLITELKIDQSNLKLHLSDIKMYGIRDCQLLDAKIDLKAKHEEFEILVPRLEMIAQYTISGRLLILPIVGSGSSNFTIPNLKINFSHDYDLVKGKTGKDHMLTKNAVTVLRKSPAFLNFDNLFGNKQLSDTTNLVLNENSSEVVADLGPAVADAVGLVLERVYNALTATIPYDVMYPENV